MKKWSLSGLALLLCLIMAGCNDSGSVKEEKRPDTIRQVFLLFTEDYIGEDEESVGTLSLFHDGKEEKVASDVLDGWFTYLNEQDKVLYINEDQELYEYKRGEEKIKLAEDVSYFAANDTEIVAYQEEDDDLYVVSADTDKEKIASSVVQHELVGEEIFYLKEDGSFLKYHIQDKIESDFASDAVQFEVLDEKGKEILYVNEDSALYYQNGDNPAVRVSGDEVSFVSISKHGKNLVFLAEDESGSTRLVSADPGSGEQVNIAKDVIEYEYVDGHYYFINEDMNLYRKKAEEQQAEKLASDVYGLLGQNDELYYQNEDMALFHLEGGKTAKKLAGGVDRYDVSPKGDVIYLNEDGSLFVNEEKIADDISHYGHFFGHLAFAGSDDKLYLMEDMGKKKVALEDLSHYSNVTYQDQRIYNNYLEFADIAGVWTISDEEEALFIELDEDGLLSDMVSGRSMELEEDYSGYSYLSASSEDGDSIDFHMNSDGQLAMSIDGEELNLDKTDHATAEKYAAQLQEQEDRAMVADVVIEYMSSIEYALYYGEMYYIEDYLVEGSALYKELEAKAAAAYEADEEWTSTDYEIINIEKTGQNQYTVKTMEEFFRGYDEDEYEIHETFENTYTLERMDDDFKITGIKEVKSDKDMDSI